MRPPFLSLYAFVAFVSLVTLFASPLFSPCVTHATNAKNATCATCATEPR